MTMSKMESTGKFIKRKTSDMGSAIYRKLVFPFVKMGIERKSGSIIGKGAYLYNDTTLEGKDYIGDKAELANVKVGYSSFIGRDSIISNTRIGRYTCIAGLQTAIGRHPVKGECVAVHPAFYSSEGQYGYTYANETIFEEVRFTDKEQSINIDIGNDVWIGKGVMVTDGVSVGDGAVIGACSLVLSDVEPYAIYAGVPAKKVGERFDKETVSKLLQLRWWDKGEVWIAEHAGEFRDPDRFLENLSPKAVIGSQKE